MKGHGLPKKQATTGHFTLIPNWIIRESDLTRNELLVYIALLSRADRVGVTWPSVPTIAKDSRLSVSSVKSTVKMLEARGLIQRTMRPRQDKNNDTNVYRVASAEPREPLANPRDMSRKTAHPGSTPDPGVGQSLAHPGSAVDHKEEPIEEDPLEESVRSSQGDDDGSFSDFSFPEEEPATDSQKAYLWDLYIHFHLALPPRDELRSWDVNLTKSEAIDLIDEYLRVMPRDLDYRGPEAGDALYDELSPRGQEWADRLMTPDGTVVHHVTDTHANSQETKPVTRAQQ